MHLRAVARCACGLADAVRSALTAGLALRCLLARALLARVRRSEAARPTFAKRRLEVLRHSQDANFLWRSRKTRAAGAAYDVLRRASSWANAVGVDNERREHVRFRSAASELKPECDALIAQYEQQRSALLADDASLSRARRLRLAGCDALSRPALLDITPAEVESTVSFYTLFFRKPVGKYMLQVCRGLMCELRGAETIMAYFREKLGIGHLETTGDGLFSYEEVECLAACDRATCMQVNLEFVYDLTPAMIDEMLAAMRAGTYRGQADGADRSSRGARGASSKTVKSAPAGKSPGTRTVERARTTRAASAIRAASSCSTASSTKDISFTGRSRERFVRDARGVAEIIEEEEGNGSHAGH